MKITKNELKKLIEEVKQEGRRRGYRYGPKKYFGDPGFSFDTGRNQPYRLIDDEPDDVDKDDDGELSAKELRALADELEDSAENLADLKFADRMRDRKQAAAQLAKDRKRFGESKIKKSDLIDLIKEEFMELSEQSLAQNVKGKLPMTESITVDVVTEDGHEDVSSARRSMKTIIEDAGQMLQALNEMDGHLPTWWTNKMAVAASNLNKMRDYLLVSSESLQEQSMFPSDPDDFVKLKYLGLKIAIPVSVALRINRKLQNKENLKKEILSFLADLRSKGLDYVGQDQYLDDINKQFFNGQSVARGY